MAAAAAIGGIRGGLPAALFCADVAWGRPRGKEAPRDGAAGGGTVEGNP
eukprot:CAMPEP_0206598840 /NCGR_PEP_ID=MMETSP0325_2-20121206/44854_1 /ASSEMBLY_ACC=CAM_ASM_000347 /TAXON_ID=2866 /ORGANISM="Crypthecodinium cohnii, Strain Seligo" /LENGTH=48 /DNA_ID= /DNA_START= /DNA_END= /DNA_ORIENTATION=